MTTLLTNRNNVRKGHMSAPVGSRRTRKTGDSGMSSDNGISGITGVEFQSEWAYR